MRHDLNARFYKSIAAPGFQTAMPSLPVVDKANRNICARTFLRAVKCYLDAKPEKIASEAKSFHFAFMALVDSLVGTIMRVFLGAFCTIFHSPKTIGI